MAKLHTHITSPVNLLILIGAYFITLFSFTTLDFLFMGSVFLIARLMWADMLEYRNKYFRAIIALLLSWAVTYFIYRIILELINH